MVTRLAALLILAAAPAQAQSYENEQQSDIGAWHVTTARHPVGSTGYAALTNKSTNSDNVLTLRCRESRTELALATNGRVDGGAVSVQNIRYSLDSEPAMYETWLTNGDRLISAAPVVTAKALVGRSRMAFEYTDYASAQTVIAKFNLRGLAQAIPHIRTACNW